MPERTCSMDGCSRAHRARGLCASHYNQAHQPDRHPRYQRTCQACGVDYTTPRKDGMYCTLECRDNVRTGTTLAERQAAREAKADRARARAERLAALAAGAFAPEQRTCEWCGTDYLATRRIKSYCTRVCKAKASKARRRALEHGAPGTYTWAEVMRIYVRLGGCAYCGEPSGDIEPDHVIPLSKGGSNSITNVVPACAPCNADKRDLSLDEWVPDRKRRSLPPRSLDARVNHLTHILVTPST